MDEGDLRRANACIIDHLPPALSNAELYDELAEVESRVYDYQAARTQDPSKLPLLQSMIWEAVEKAQIDRDLSLSGDSADPDDVKVRTTVEEARHIFRSRLLNPKWLKGLQRHGYKGAGDNSKAMDIIIGWDATANVVDDWMYRRFADKVALNPDMCAWMKQVNPHALHNIVDKLLEAAARDLWRADSQTLEALREVYLEIEGDIEEITD